MQTVKTLCVDYILQHDLRETSSDQYHRVVGVFVSWAGRDVSIEEFDERSVSQFLLDKQLAGLSSHYRKSLRNTLVALLRFAGRTGKVRSVRLTELEPQSWTTEEVRKLLAACDKLRGEHRRAWWRSLIATAYYTGLGYVDLQNLERKDFDAIGRLRWRRSKTGKRVSAAIPLDLLASLPDGKLWPMTTTLEAFRRSFGRIVKNAGLSGTFKKLRKTTGTLVDMTHPGRGHELLANSRVIFERHYRDRADSDAVPLMPPTLRAPA